MAVEDGELNPNAGMLIPAVAAGPISFELRIIPSRRKRGFEGLEQLVMLVLREQRQREPLGQERS